MDKKFDVVCLGILVADVLGKPIDRIPGKGQLVMFDRMELHTGGCANNTGIGLSRLGARTACVGKVGTDGFGGIIIRTLQNNGVNTDGIRKDNAHNTSFTFVMIHSDGERSFFHYAGANGNLKFMDIDFSIIQKAKILHVAGFNLMPGFDGTPAKRVFEKAKRMGVTTSLDTAWSSSGKWDIVLPCLEYVDIFLPSYEEAKLIAKKEEPEKIAEFFMDKGVKIVGIKMGKKGCYIRTEKEEFRIPSYKVNAIDSSGAGDSFVAGFLAGLIKGYDLKTCAKLGNAVGASCVTAIGCTTGVRGLKETLKRFKIK